jgi:hypothetical protein
MECHQCLGMISSCGEVISVALTEHGVTPSELGRLAPLMVIFPVLVSCDFKPPGPQIPSTAAWTVTFLIDSEWALSARRLHGKPLGETARQVAPVKVAPVMVAPEASLVPLSLAWHGIDTAIEVTVMEPFAVKAPMLLNL